MSYFAKAHSFLSFNYLGTFDYIYMQIIHIKIEVATDTIYKKFLCIISHSLSYVHFMVSIPKITFYQTSNFAPVADEMPPFLHFHLFFKYILSHFLI